MFLWKQNTKRRADPHYQFFKHEKLTTTTAAKIEIQHNTTNLKHKSSCSYLESVPPLYSMYTNQSIYSAYHIHRIKFPAGSYHPGYVYFPRWRKEINHRNMFLHHSTNFAWKCYFSFFPCHQTSNISRTLAGNRIVDHWHSEVVGTLPVGTAPTTSSFFTKHLATMDWTKTTARPWTTVTMTWLLTWLIVYALCHKPQKWCHKLWNRQRTRANHWIYKLHLTLNMFDIQAIYGHCHCFLAV